MPDTTDTPASAETMTALMRFLREKLHPDDYEDARAIVADGSGAAMDASLRRRVTAALARKAAADRTALERQFPGVAKLKRAL